MVYFEKGCRYGSKPVIIVDKVDKDTLTYRFSTGTVQHTSPIKWARLKTVSHPVQYVKVRGKPIWAVEKK